MPKYYPVMLDVRGRPALVIGGDHVAAEKAAALSASGAQVTVQSPVFCDELLDLARSRVVMLRYKAYEVGDLAGAFVVIAATTYDEALSEAIWQEALEHEQLVNIVDMPVRCNFILPSILRRGQLTISVSTEGASPGLAKRIRQRMEELFPPAYAPYMRIASIARTYLKTGGVTYAERDNFFADFFDSDILDLLSEGDEIEALASTVRLLRHYQVDISVATLVNDMKEAEASHGNNQRG